MPRLMKVVIIGDQNAHKSELISKFCFSDRPLEAQPVGMDFKIKSIHVNNEDIKLHIWDTAGKEQLTSITDSYLKNVDVVILAFAKNNKASCDFIQEFYDKNKNNFPEECSCTCIEVDDEQEASVLVEYKLVNKGLPIYICRLDDIDEIKAAFTQIIEHKLDLDCDPSLGVWL